MSSMKMEQKLKEKWGGGFLFTNLHLYILCILFFIFASHKKKWEILIIWKKKYFE